VLGRVLVLLIALAVVVGSGCRQTDPFDGTGDADHARGGTLITATPHAARIDELHGRYDGVRIGDPQAKVERRLGKAPAWHIVDDTAPLGVDQSDIAGASGRCRLPGQDKYAHDEFLRYEAVSIWAPEGRACSFQVTAPDAVTSRGVRIGDDLDNAMAAYPELFCGTANEDTEYATYPYCKGRLPSGVYLWFGGDPISDIEFGHSPLNP
jgi:hypothetical protein